MNKLPIADHNVERLLREAYEPEPIDPAFVAELEARLCAAASSQAAALTTPPPRAAEDQRLRRVRRRLGWAMGLAASLAACFLVYYAQTRPGLPLDLPRTIHTKDIIETIDGVRPTSADKISHALTPRSKPAVVPVKPASVGTVLKTTAGERRRVLLADGTVLYLNHNTEAHYSAARTLVLKKGEVYVEVTPREAGSGQTFVVQTSTGNVSALGTRFAVAAHQSGPAVVVTQGKVKVSGISEEIRAGQRLQPGAKKASVAPRTSHLLDWTRELMAAAQSPLVPCSNYTGGTLVALDPFGQEVTLTLRKFHIDVHIEDGFARTTIDQTYFNNNHWRMEGTFYFPLPAEASLSRLAMYVVDGGDCKIMEGGMAEREHARTVFETIMYQRRDPALLEWVDGSTFKMRVFPLEGRQEKRIILSYTQRLPKLYGTAQYRFPGGHNMELVRDWSFHAFVKHGAKLRVTSDSHPDMKLQAKGADLVLDVSARAIKPNRDVTVEMYDTQDSQRDQAYFSSFVHENQNYLMVRYRPALAETPKRERRDWVILFEAAANRDPLLARAQMDVLKYLLENAEHDDTFVLITANTRVHKFDQAPRALSAKNLAEALTFLEGTHLVGALDLGQALEAARPYLVQSQNPHLLHLGAGIPAMGERADDKLARLLPENTRYVGIGVGKRWNRSFMKQAADRTGGFFTQINPDEPIAWRAFDLLATLNTPRLMDVRVLDAAEKATFLSENAALAQGEELVAYTRVPGPLPEKIVLSGLLNGQTWTKTLEVKGVVPGAGYLPRTWAKLEIDRLLADGAEKNKKAVTELSLAMYVMSPFTSLLVLETEQDYVTYKVDRGRKDHWAMYECPPRIPLVHEPDPNQQAWNNPWWMNPAQANKNKKDAKDVLDTILLRTQPQVLLLPGQMQQQWPQFLTATQLFAGAYRHALEFETLTKDLETTDDMLQFLTDERVAGKLKDKTGNQNLLMAFDILSKGPARLGSGPAPMGQPGEFKKGPKASELRLSLDFGFKTPGYFINGGDGFGMMGGGFGMMGMGNGQFTNPDGLVQFAPMFASPTLQWATPNLGLQGWSNPLTTSITPIVMTTTPASQATLVTGLLPSLETPMKSLDPLVGPAANEWGQVGAGRDAKELAEDKRESLIHEIAWQLTHGGGQRSLLYQKPQVINDQRLFTDLTMYAAGLHTSTADIQAALEREAKAEKPLPPGQIDQGARKLIEQARALDWHAITIPAEKKRDRFLVTFAGDGRFAYERVLPTGLKETVVCDGGTLWHLYPEIGLGSKRPYSRHHFGTLSSLVPWALPSAEELAAGADVKLVDKNTVALISRQALAKLAANKKDKASKETPAPVFVLHLVFGPDHRLVERRVVNLTDNKVVLRQTYDHKGVVRLLDKDGKVLAESNYALVDAEEPVLTPDVKDLLVLTLPQRTVGYLFAALPNWNGSFAKLDKELAESLFVADCLQHQGWRAVQCFGERFASKGDRRLGFYVLLAAANVPLAENKYTWNSTAVSFNVTKEHPNSALAHYLAHNEAILQKGVADRLENLPGDKNGFIQRLAEVRNLWRTWVQDHPSRHGAEKLQAERVRALKFLRSEPPPLFAWAILESVFRYQAGNVVADAGELYKNVGERLGLMYAARYEVARSLLHAGKTDDAARQFLQLYEEAARSGGLPAIDHDFRTALARSNKDGEEDAFGRLMRQRHQRLLKDKHMQAAFLLCWQVYQLGGGALADELFNVTLAAAPARKLAIVGGLEYLCHTGQFARADLLLQEILKDKEFSGRAAAWRLSFTLAQRRGLLARASAALEKAMDLEYRALPEVINLHTVRADYGNLLQHYQQLATALSMLEKDAPQEFVAKVVRAADRWRALDPANPQPCQQAARILQTLGAKELAWDYLTTPIGMKPNEAAPWLGLAQALQQDAEFELADRAFVQAYEAEPTNAEILWNRAANLTTIGRMDQARAVYRQIAEGTWQPRFQWLQQQARWHAFGQ